MTLALSEKDIQELIDMKDVVSAVEEAFRQQGRGAATNSRRTRSDGKGAVLSVMHANLAYLGRGGLKAYMHSKAGAKFVFVLFDASDSTPLALMGADTLGRYRTGAASGVATKHLYGKPRAKAAIFGSGKQALTQVLALSSVMRLDEVRVWSPNGEHRNAFARRLSKAGFSSSSHGSPGEALEGAEVASAITSSGEPFLTDDALASAYHLNICGSNLPSRSEATPAAVGSFDTVVVDDMDQGRVEYGDLIQAADAGTFSWSEAIELGAVVAGARKPRGRTLFKSGGAALEDVAAASVIYDKAMKSGRSYPSVSLV